jgi:hypothetical protein
MNKNVITVVAVIVVVALIAIAVIYAPSLGEMMRGMMHGG